MTTEDGRREAIISAVAMVDGYDHPNTKRGDYWDIRLVFVTQLAEDFVTEARQSVLAALRRDVEALAFEFDDDAPRRFMVERSEVLALIDKAAS